VDFIEQKGNRSFQRFSVRLSGRFLSGGQDTGWKECTIIEISRNGMLITYPLSEKIHKGATVCLEIYIPKQLDSLNAKGTVRWLKQTENSVISGIELCKPVDENIFSKLD